MEKKLITDIITLNVISVQPETPFTEVLNILSSRKISCILVVKDAKPIGIITERDTVKLSINRSYTKKATAHDCMSSPVVSALENVDIYEAYHILSVNNIRHLAVTDTGGNLKGIITQTNIIDCMGLDTGEIRKVSKIMQRNLLVMQDKETLGKAVQLMKNQRISCLIIHKHQKPLGIITERDITRFLHQKLDFKKTLIKDVMTAPVVSTDDDTPIHEAVRLMKLSQIRRILIVDKKGHVSGLVTQSDIIKGVLEGKYIETLRDILQQKDAMIHDVERSLIEKTIFLDSILYSAKDLGILATDVNLRINFYNPAAEKIFGWTAADVQGKCLKELAMDKPASYQWILDAVEHAREDEEYMDIVELTKEKEKNAIVGIKASVIKDIRDKRHETRGYFLMAKDITHRRREEDILRVQEEKYRSIFENSRDTVYITTLNGEFIEINPAGTELFGYQKNDLLEVNARELYKEPKKRDVFIQEILKQNYVKDYEVEFINKDGKVVSTLITAALQTDEQGNPVGFQGIIRDITERKKQEEVINYMAFHDQLTGLPNRGTFLDHLALAIVHAKRHKTIGAVLFIDLDKFKEVNDTYGHSAGDRLLIQAAMRFKDILREEDTVARLGGDEFTIILPDIKKSEDAVFVANKLTAEFEKPIRIGEMEATVSLSIGISLFPQDGIESETLLDNADEAMYLAKQSGRNGSKLYADVSKQKEE